MKKWLPLIGLILLSVLAWYFGLSQYLTFETLKAHQSALDQFITQHFIWALVVYMLVYITIVALSIPGAAFMTLSGGILFGQWVGTSATVLSATLGAVLLFLAVRLAAFDFLRHRAQGWVARMQQGFQEHAFFYLLTLRLIPLFPFVAVNLVAGILQIPLRIFFISTLIGIIPGSFVYTSMGVAIRAVLQQDHVSPQILIDPKILIALVGLGLLSLLPVAYHYWQKR